MITFSLNPLSGSTLLPAAASVRTRVVSWKEAAEMKLSVARRGLGDAKQDDSSTGPSAAQPLDSLVLLGNVNRVHLLVVEEIGVARIGDLDLADHLPDDDLDVLVVDLHPLQAVDFLDFGSPGTPGPPRCRRLRAISWSTIGPSVSWSPFFTSSPLCTMMCLPWGIRCSSKFPVLGSRTISFSFLLPARRIPPGRRSWRCRPRPWGAGPRTARPPGADRR